MTATQPKLDTDPRRTAWRPFSSMCWTLAGDPVLVPFRDGQPDWESTTRDTITKIAHWSDIEDADIPRLAILTDSFARFIGNGDDASIVTLWREGTPDVRQIDGKPNAAALDLVMDAITGNQPMRTTFEKLGDRLTEELEAKKATREAANDNEPLTEKLRKAFEGGKLLFNGDTRTYYLAEVWRDGKIGIGFLGASGEPLFEPYQVQPRPPIHATPFRLRDPASLPERAWLYARHYIRKYLTATVGAGGGGKSAHAVSEVLAMVTGRPLLDPDGPLTKPIGVWYVNAEDPQEEIDRRFHAAAKHFSVTAEQINGRLYTDSGRDQEFVIMRQEGRDLKVCQPVVDELVSEIQRRQIDVLIVDPFVSTHEVPENDNGAMQRVAKAWTEVADKANCGVEIIHHIVKSGGEVTADSARGGGALKDKTRGMRVLNPMTDAEATKVGLESPNGYFRIDQGKANLVAVGRSAWRRFVSVPLGNGKGLLKAGDEIGVVEPWHWPSAESVAERAAEARRAIIADVSADLLAGFKVRLENADYKESVQAGNWAGKLVAELFDLDPKVDRDQIKAMLAAWIEAGELEIVDIPDAYRHLKPHVKPAAAP